tara:strand:+ start:578 stop:808 length:231 start_codon:yes stop_codon:yes gene_type:complete
MLAIAAYAQDLGTFLLKLGVCLVKGRNVIGSTSSKVENVEREDHVLLALELAKSYLVTSLVWKAKFWGGLSDFCCH